MPGEAPGQRYVATATKATSHGLPAVELNHAGIAAKSQQTAPAAPSVANAALAVQIGVGEQFTIMMAGVHSYVPMSVLPAGANVGDQLYIHPADNSIVEGSAHVAGDVKWGLLEEINSAGGTCAVNLSQRSSF